MPKGEGARKSKMLGRAIETDVATLESGKAVNTENSNTVNTESSSAINSASQQGDQVVSLTIKVSHAYRQHWQVEAKKRGTSVTSLIVEALAKELGLPK